MSYLLILFSLFLPGQALAAKAVMEGIASTKQTIFVDTATGRVDVATASYGGGISSVGLHVSSNVVVSNDGTNHVVIYATGAVMVNGALLRTGTGDAVKSADEIISGTWTHTGEFKAQAASTFTGTAYFGSTVTSPAGGVSLSSGTGGWTANFRYSTTTVPATVQTGTVFSICFATVTLVSNGGAVEVYFSGGINQLSGDAHAASSYYLDSGYAPGTSSTVGLGGSYAPGTNLRAQQTWRQIVKPSAGTHSYCFTGYSNDGNNTFCHASYFVCEFGAREIQ